MRPAEHWSLSARLIGLSLVAALICAGLAGWLLREQLHQVLLRSFDKTLQERADRLRVELAASGSVETAGRALEEGEFGQIFSGWYWVLVQGERVWRSRSLWDATLALAQARPFERAGTTVLWHVRDPRGAPLLGTQRTLPMNAGPAQLHVFGPLHDTEAEWRRIDQVLLLTQGGFILALALFTFVQVRLGLSPLRRLRRNLVSVHDRQASAVGNDYGPDLNPIAQTIDRVLARNEQVVERARHQAANLSHALKKPMALLNVHARGDSVSSELLRAQIAAMTHTIDRHLARFGSGAGTTQVVNVLKLLDALLTLMRQIHAGRGLDWRLDAPGELRWTGAAADLEEMAGDLLDNAGKWSRSAVRVQACARDGALVITISDDGPGIGPEQLKLAARRGQRFDETVEGHGLGLSIVQDIAGTYGGELTLRNGSDGGLVSVLTLP